MTYQYMQREIMKTAIDIPDQTQDSDIDRALMTATGDINGFTGRCFQPYLATRTIDVPSYPLVRGRVLLSFADLLEITTLRTDDGTWTYPYAWAAGTWRLGPEDAIYKNPPHPYWWIERASVGSAYDFPCGISRGVQIEGKWGFYDVHRASGATVVGALDAATLTIPVSSLAPFEVGHSLLIGTEQLYVTAKNVVTNPAPDTLTVEMRGANGTTAATHADGAAIDIYSYPVVDQACMLLATRYLRRRTTPYGVVGNADVGQIRLAINDPDVLGLLSKLSLTAMG